MSSFCVFMRSDTKASFSLLLVSPGEGNGMEIMVKKWIASFIVLFSILLLFGCSNTQEGVEYKIYYRDVSGNGITAISRYITSTAQDKKMNEMWSLFITAPDNEKVNTASFDGIEIQQVLIDENDTLNVYFNEAYSKMQQVDELLFRAAFVKTFIQLEGISSVQFYVNGNALTDYEGNNIGRMKGSDFVDILGQDINEIESQIVTLYFANEAGDKLIPKKIEAYYGTGYALERYILEALIAGPYEENESLYPVLPSDLKVLSISVKDGTCYVNFDGTFLNNSLNVSDYIPVYAIVNSLSELSGVNKVQISVNGSSNEKFNGTLSLSNTFERNLDYVQSSIQN